MIRPLNVKNQAYTPKNELLSLYFKDITDFKVLSANEEFHLFEAIKNGDENAKRKVIECNQKFVVSVAKKFSVGDNLLDLINEGNIGLIEAIDKFDNYRGIKFISFAVHYIHREIHNYLRSNNLVRQTNLGKTYDILNKVKSIFFAQNGRMPTTQEIIGIMKDEYDIDIIDESDVYDLEVSSIDDCGTDDRDNTDTTDFNRYYFYENSCNLKYEREENRNNINELINVLTTEEFYILKLYYGIDCWREFSLDEISDITGYTSERIRQLKDDAIDKMRSYNKIKKVV